MRTRDDGRRQGLRGWSSDGILLNMQDDRSSKRRRSCPPSPKRPSEGFAAVVVVRPPHQTRRHWLSNVVSGAVGGVASAVVGWLLIPFGQPGPRPWREGRIQGAAHHRVSLAPVTWSFHVRPIPADGVTVTKTTRERWRGAGVIRVPDAVDYTAG